MNRVFCANMMRLKKNKLFWLGIVLIAGYGIFNCCSVYRMMQKYGDAEGGAYPLDNCLLTFMPVIGIVLSVVISMYLGTDYSDGTIRNKIMAGKSRNSIYTANFLTCSVIGVATYCFGLLSVALVGTPLLGGIQEAPLTVAILLADGVLMVLANAAIFNMIAMLASNKAHGAVISILAAFGLLFLSIYIFNVLSQPEMVEELVMSVEEQMPAEQIPEHLQKVKNPRYVGGLKRKFYEFLTDLLPSGQGIQLASFVAAHSCRMAGCSVAVAAVFHVAGSMIFRKKNIK